MLHKRCYSLWNLTRWGFHAGPLSGRLLFPRENQNHIHPSHGWLPGRILKPWRLEDPEGKPLGWRASESLICRAQWRCVIDQDAVLQLISVWLQTETEHICNCDHAHAQLCPTLCDSMVCSLPGSSVHGILQARILQWVAMPFSKGFFQPRDQTCISSVGRWILYHWATCKPSIYTYIHTYIHIYFYFIVSCTLYSYYITIYDIKCYSPKSFSDIQQNFVQILYCCNSSKGFPGGSYSKESACNMGHLGSIPGLGKFPWMRAWQPTPVFLPGEFPWTEEPGGLQSMGLQRVRHDWVTKHSTAQF